jgi:hypothetical protein
MSTTFRDLLGINAGKEWDQLYNENNQYGYNPLMNIFSHVRSFHLMEDDYPKGKLPSNSKPDVALPGAGGWGRMNNYTIRYQQWARDFETLRVSLTGIHIYNSRQKKMEMRQFPSKWYSKADWGGDQKTIFENAKRYGSVFFPLHVPKDHVVAPLIHTLEVGNEPWGSIGIEGYQTVLKGIIAAHQEYYGKRPLVRLSSAAFQAHEPNHVWKCNNCNYPSGDYIGKILDKELLDQLQEITIHPYSFTKGSTKLIEPPESPDSDFQEVRHFFAFREKMQAHHLTISATEFGWDSQTVGEAAQAAYTLRNILMMARMGFYKAYLYEGIDNAGLKGLYGSSGLFEAKLPGRHIARPKLIYKVLLQFMHTVGDLEVVAALQEDKEAYVYLLGKEGEATHLIAWRPNDFLADSQPDAPKSVRLHQRVQSAKLRLGNTFRMLDGTIELDKSLRCINNSPALAVTGYVRGAEFLEGLKLSGFPYLFELQ